MTANELRTASRLSCLGAALVLRRNDQSRELILELKGSGCPRESIRESILQTYLFDGYPTALEGMELLFEVWPEDPAPAEEGSFSAWTAWQARGRELYKRIYGDVADRLEQKAARLSPELARWMIVEGYGKVLARPGLDIVARELVVIAVLAVKERPRQLQSHLRGALRVGAAKETIERVLDELQHRLNPPGLQNAYSLLERILA